MGQFDGIRAAPEQQDADFFFQLGELLAERRLGDMQFFGGAGEILLLGDLDDVLQLAEFHVYALPFAGI